eukprot:Hpha_TRINITY_DN16345_c0_g2::TRINITY_DN16345_c0_g2_i1::g.59859::m.59859
MLHFNVSHPHAAGVFPLARIPLSVRQSTKLATPNILHRPHATPVSRAAVNRATRGKVRKPRTMGCLQSYDVAVHDSDPNGQSSSGGGCDADEIRRWRSKAEASQRRAEDAEQRAAAAEAALEAATERAESLAAEVAWLRRSPSTESYLIDETMPVAAP